MEIQWMALMWPFIIYGYIINIFLICRLRYPIPAVLLILVPWVNLFALGVFAFRRSPIEDELEDLRLKLDDLESQLVQARTVAGTAK